MNVLVTGATGFLGSVVTRTLAEHGYRLRIVHRRESRIESVAPYAASLAVADISDPLETVKAALGMDAIVHMAADLSHWSRHRDRIFRTNVIGTRVIAEAAKTAGVPTLLHVSSIAAVGYSSDGQPIDEEAPNNFVPLKLLYHESKRLAEEEALDARRYGVKVVIVNPGVLYGPRSLEHTFGHTMLELAQRRIPGHPSGGISVADVEDVAHGIASALKRGSDGQRYLLAGHNVSYKDLFERQANILGVPYDGKPIPAFVLAAMARAFELRSRFTGKEPRLNVDNAKIAPLRMWYDSGKAHMELGYRFRPLEETFGRMADAYAKAGVLKNDFTG